MNKTNEYQSQFSIRNSDRMAATLVSSDSNDPLISSDTLNTLSDKFKAGADTFDIISGMAALVPGGGPVSRAAAGTAALAKIAAEAAKQAAASAKAQEKANSERKAMERQIKEGTDRAMRDHNDRMSRGEYRDPPTPERMAEIGRMC